MHRLPQRQVILGRHCDDHRASEGDEKCDDEQHVVAAALDLAEDEDGPQRADEARPHGNERKRQRLRQALYGDEPGDLWGEAGRGFSLWTILLPPPPTPPQRRSISPT